MDQQIPVPDEGYALEPPLRMHHLTGGLGALIGSNRLAMLLSPKGPGLVFFCLMPKAFFPSTLKMQPGIRFLGGTQFNSAEEMQDPISSSFLIAAQDSAGRSLADSQFHHWNGVTVALRQMGREPESIMTSRLDCQIRLCKDRFERLSIAYRTILSSIPWNDKNENKISFTGDKYAHYIGSEYRSMLNELFSMRDAILAVTYRIRFNRTDPYKFSKLKQCVQAESAGSGKLIFDSMFSSVPGIIERMSLYRSVAQHSLGANNPALGDVYKISLSKGQYGELPYVIFPLYDDIEKMRLIEQGSSKGILGQTSREESIRFMSLPSHQDALEFCYDCYVNMLRICELLAAEISIEPKVFTITDDDIIEATFTDEHGKIKRMKRDDATGHLVEY
jgi:hypothetical protein